MTALHPPTILLSDGLPDPLGLGSAHPVLSWTPAEPAAAWQVQASGSPQELARETGLLWDSGALPPDALPAVWGGPPLHSRQVVFWRVRALDSAGIFSPWSTTAFMEVGLLDSEDWMAAWISPANPDQTQPAFRKTFPLNAPAARARLYSAVSAEYEIQLNGWTVGQLCSANGPGPAAACTFDVTRLLQPRENVLGLLPARGSRQGTPAVLAQLEVELVDGNLLVIVSDDTWRTGFPAQAAAQIQPAPVRAPASSWLDPRYDDSSWQAAVMQPDLPAAPLSRPRPTG